MQFICLIYSDPALEPKPDTPEMAAYMQAYGDFTEMLMKDGKFVAGNELQGAETATTVSVRNGKTETMDGPFAETKEVLGGYYLLECEDLDDALKCAAQIPSVEHGQH